MAIWINPVFDRTIQDVESAKVILEQWKREGFAAELLENLKGCLNASDLNRIEENIQYLAESLNDLHYFNDIPLVLYGYWGGGMLGTAAEISRIIGYADLLCDAFARPESPKLPDKLTHYTEVNDLEEVLYKLKQYLDSIIKSFPKCGTFKSGKRALPLRRF